MTSIGKQLLAVSVVVAAIASASLSSAQIPGSSVNDALEFIFDQHDLFHRHFYVYRDRDSGDANFFPSGWMGDLAHAKPPLADNIINDNSTDRPFSGRTCIKLSYPHPRVLADRERWSAIYWQFPTNNWEGRGYDLRKYAVPGEAIRLSFHVRAEAADRRKLWSEFKTGGMKADSFGPITTGTIELSRRWTRHSMEVQGDLRNVAGGFCWTANRDELSDTCTIFLDEIRFEFGPRGTARRLAEPRFVRSYVPSESDQVDQYFRNAAYCYDNALVVLACCARGTAEDLRHARLICDAFIEAQQHDEYGDGRLRNVYSCGDLLDPAQGGIPRLPGWWDDEKREWIQDHPYFVSTDCGNMAWVGLALLTYAEHAEDNAAYVDAAERICDWIFTHAKSDLGAGGYRGGIELGEKDAKHPDGQHYLTFKSTEHNIDIYPLFKRLALATGNDVWNERAEHAANFVHSMINHRDGHLWTGTTEDGVTINRSPLPLDVNTWALLAFRDTRRFAPAVDWAAKNCDVRLPDGLQAFDFDTDRDAVWWEGTGQMALCFKLLGDRERSHDTLDAIRRHGFTREPKGGVLAASHDGLTTGFTKDWGDWVYWKRPQTGGATCWYIFAELGWNPYWAESVTK